MPSAIILAGGQGRRLGQDKASLVVAGKMLLQRVVDKVAPLVDEVIIVKRRRQELPPVAVGALYIEPLRPVVVVDAFPGKGPLGGLYTGLSAATSFPALGVACDMPLLQLALLEELLRLASGFEAVVPLRAGQAEPLCAVYTASCVGAISARIEQGDLRMSSLPDDLRTRFVSEDEWQRFDADGLSFFNLNTPEDLATAEALLG